jgi:3-deoxy-D-manno-octulosonic-acid transferase
MLIVYRFFYFLISKNLVSVKPRLSNKFQQWISLRQAQINLPPSDRQRILFHAASGEIEYVKSTIREIKSQRPDLEIFVSYSSPSAEKLFLNIKDLVTHFVSLPWDRPSDIQLFIDQIKPSIVIFSRTDFWPELIHHLHAKKIPMIAVSLFPNFGFFQKKWLKFNLSKMNLITVVSEDVKTELTKILDKKNIQILPDTRFDQVLYRLKNESTFKMSADQKIMVWGSTWPEDESILTQILQQILNSGFQIVWCPHDVTTHRISAIQTMCLKYKTTLFSEKSKHFHFSEQILILDQIGHLADMYRFSDIAFIGGSFKSKVHSVMEPLCAGNPVIVGPFYKNNPEAVQFEKMGFVQSIRTSDEFLSAFLKLNNINRIELLQETVKMSGSTQKTVALILNFLKT